MKILVLNCGSSSIKYQLFDMETKAVLAKGGIEKIGLEGSFLKLTQPDGEKVDSGMKSAMKDRFVAGDVSEGDAINVLVSYGLAKDKSDAYWQVDQWEHIAETGSSDGYGKYNDFTEAVRTGKNLKTVTSTYLNNGVTKSTLAGRITDTFDKEYVQLYKTDKRAAAALKARLLTAYELLGYDRTKKSKDIDRWIKD